jgi:hypothetical protein
MLLHRCPDAGCFTIEVPPLCPNELIRTSTAQHPARIIHEPWLRTIENAEVVDDSDISTVTQYGGTANHENGVIMASFTTIGPLGIQAGK